MNGSEKSLWQWLWRDWKKVPKSLLHAHRVENSASSGMPDVEGCYHPDQFWIELKVAVRPAHSTTEVDVTHLRPKQVQWLHNRWLVGGNAWILLRVDDRDGGNSRLYLIPGEHALQVRCGLTELELLERSACMTSATPRELLRLVTKQ